MVRLTRPTSRHVVIPERELVGVRNGHDFGGVEDWVGIIPSRGRCNSLRREVRDRKKSEAFIEGRNMPGRKPRSAENIANQYDDDAMVPSEVENVIPWDEARKRLAEGGSFWWATTRPDGRPHIRPVLAVLVDDVLYSTTNRAARKARNLATNPRFAITLSTDDIDFIVEGMSAPVTEVTTLERVADAYREKYDWPVTVREGAFHAPFGAPTAGPPPYQAYALTPDVIYGLGTNERYALRSTRWRFST